jgi:hypothetical protein
MEFRVYISGGKSRAACSLTRISCCPLHHHLGPRGQFPLGKALRYCRIKAAQSSCPCNQEQWMAHPFIRGRPPQRTAIRLPAV